MKTVPCIDCGHLTRRADEHCPNCVTAYLPEAEYEDFLLPAAERAKFENPDDHTILEIPRRMAVARIGGGCVDCGYERYTALSIQRKYGNERGLDQPKPRLKTSPEERAFYGDVGCHPENYFLRCFNCMDRFKLSPGRPPKNTPEEKQAIKPRLARSYYDRARDKAFELIGRTCVLCDKPTEQIVWEGAQDGVEQIAAETGKDFTKTLQAGGKYWFIVKYEQYRHLFMPYCRVHKPAPYFLRASLGEVPRPRSWNPKLTARTLTLDELTFEEGYEAQPFVPAPRVFHDDLQEEEEPTEILEITPPVFINPMPDFLRRPRA